MRRTWVAPSDRSIEIPLLHPVERSPPLHSLQSKSHVCDAGDIKETGQPGPDALLPSPVAGLRPGLAQQLRTLLHLGRLLLQTGLAELCPDLLDGQPPPNGHNDPVPDHLLPGEQRGALGRPPRRHAGHKDPLVPVPYCRQRLPGGGRGWPAVVAKVPEELAFRAPAKIYLCTTRSLNTLLFLLPPPLCLLPILASL